MMRIDDDPDMEADIAAFVDGRLDGRRRWAVADYLAERPALAAETMREIRLSEALRLTLGTVAAPLPPRVSVVADVFTRGIAGRRFVRRLAPIAAALVLVASGWFGHWVFQVGVQRSHDRNREALIESAFDAEEALSLRQSLTSALGPLPVGAGDISSRLGIELPRLPEGWVVTGAQIVATPERPGLALAIDTPDQGEITLFSVVQSVDGPDGPPASLVWNGRPLAVFERGPAAYVLLDRSTPEMDLSRGAQALLSRFE